MAKFLLVVTLTIVAAIIYSICGWRRDRRFEESFPPITDAEFMARCTPGTSSRVALRVRRIVADNLAVEYERIYPSSSFIEDLGAE